MPNKLPALFIGHGSPMNALADNSYTRHLSDLGRSLPRPTSILVISAHWETQGSKILNIPKPKTIHDFYGFPQTLFDIQYPADGAMATALELQKLIPEAMLDMDWGFDHGTWSVLRHMYPLADIPVLQLSLDKNLNYIRDHFELAKLLRPLRTQGVLILGSGNLVHNLREINFSTQAPAFTWATEFDEMIKQAILNRDYKEIFAQVPEKHSLWKRAHPSFEHYLPLMYILGATEDSESIQFTYEEIQNGSISMRSLKIG